MQRLLEAVRAAVRWTSLALLAALVLTPIAQIVMRGAFSLPFAGAEELTRYFLIAFTFIAAAYVSEQGGQIRMEEFQAWLPPSARWRLQLAIEAAGAAMFACLCVASVVTVAKNLDNKTATLELPFPILFAPIVDRRGAPLPRVRRPPRASVASPSPGREADHARVRPRA